MASIQQKKIADARDELLELLYDGLAVTNPERYRSEALTSLCEIFHTAFEAMRAEESEPMPEGVALLRATLQKITEITESIGSPPAQESRQVVRFFFEEDFRGFRAGYPVVFMGLDHFQHQAERAKRAGEFLAAGLRVGEVYQLAEVPWRDGGRRFAIVAPNGEQFATDLSYFGRIILLGPRAAS